MPSDKRARKREGRQARQEAERAAQLAARRRRTYIRAGIFVVLFVAAVALITTFQKDDAGGKKLDTFGSTSTTEKGGPSTTATKPKAGTTPCPPAAGAPERMTAFDGVPRDCLDDAKQYRAKVETDVGSFTVELDRKRAPATVNNFVFLARYRYFEGIVFHRVIPGFVVQGGDPEGTGTGGPGYQFDDELPKAGEYEIGSLAMANSGPNTNGSQFFVVTGPQGESLPPSYSLFGKVTEGMDVVKKIEADGTPEGKPKTLHKMIKVTIEEH
ncbi:MAG TPA: peptidylprolyl isomerase [Acidimicrobiales bacterium]|nr:peptidylprolyl isomerase [Acidimicrobiales bacterium]